MMASRHRIAKEKQTMKTGRTIVELATEIERQVATRRDYLAPTQALTMLTLTPPDASASKRVVLSGLNGDAYGIRPNAHSQIASEVGIPKPYYDRMLRDAPDLLATNVNNWFRQEPKKRMVRTLDGHARGFLSDRYRPLDNLDLMQAALPVVQERRAEIISSELTDTRFYLKIADPTIVAPAPNARKVGDLVSAGVVIRNSEIGHGALALEALMYQYSCANGAILGISLKKFHVGKRADEFSAVREIMSTEAKVADDRAFWLAFRDTLRAAFDEEIFHANIAKANEAAGRQIVGAPEKVVERVIEVTLGPAPTSVRTSILRSLIDQGDFTQYGMSYAITAAAQSNEVDYEYATEMERAGGRVIELDASEWSAVAK
jgi:hypothetical protein